MSLSISALLPSHMSSMIESVVKYDVYHFEPREGFDEPACFAVYVSEGVAAHDKVRSVQEHQCQQASIRLHHQRMQNVIVVLPLRLSIRFCRDRAAY